MYGNNLRTLRIENGLTQKQLAEKLNTSLHNISKYESEKLDLSTEMIIKICDYFQVSADYLLGIKED